MSAEKHTLLLLLQGAIEIKLYGLINIFLDFTGQFSCKGCRNTSYCSPACQAEDWTAHRHMCQTAESTLLW